MPIKCQQFENEGKVSYQYVDVETGEVVQLDPNVSYVIDPVTDEVIPHLSDAKTFTPEGAELNDPTPAELPVGFETSDSQDMISIIRRLTALEVRRQYFKETGQLPDDTLEDFDDFDVEDEDGDHFESQLEVLSGGRLKEKQSKVIDEEPVKAAPVAAPQSQDAGAAEQPPVQK